MAPSGVWPDQANDQISTFQKIKGSFRGSFFISLNQPNDVAQPEYNPMLFQSAFGWKGDGHEAIGF